MRRGGYRTVKGVARRETEWLGSADSTAPIALSASTVLLSQTLSAASLALRPFTVVRVRGSVFLRTDQVTANEAPFGSFGMCVVNDTAAALGVTAIPGPDSDIGSDLWFLHKIWAIDMFTSAATTEPATINGWEFDFDSKAMRKVNGDQDIAVVIENASAGFAANFILRFRMLVKLH